MQSLSDCIGECASAGESHVYDGDTHLKFLKSGFWCAGYRFTVSDFDRSQNRTEISETGAHEVREQRVYETHLSGAERKKVNSFVLIRGESGEENKCVWEGTSFSFFFVVGGGIKRALKWHL